MAEVMIHMNGVGKSYQHQQVLRDVTFSIEKGQVVGLLGPNGAGKTTIVRLLNGVILPDSGTLAVGGLNPVADGGAVRQMSGVMTEGAGLYHELSGVENLRFFSKLYGLDSEKRIQELLEQFGLAEHQQKPVGKYSTGMKKRLALAKALLHRPSVLFLDEPTNGLDPDGIREVLTLIQQLNREQGTTILICSHVLHQLEHICHSYLFLDKGKVIEAGTKEDIERKYLREVRVRIQTNLALTGSSFVGFPARQINPATIEFSLPSKREIPGLLRAILAQAEVYEAQIVNDHLELLYFLVRGERYE